MMGSFHDIIIIFFYSSVEGFGLEAEARMTTWHVAVPSENESDSVQSQDVSEGSSLALLIVICAWINVCRIKGIVHPNNTTVIHYSPSRCSKPV